MNYFKSILVTSVVTFSAFNSFAEDQAVILNPVIVTANPLGLSSDRLTQSVTLLEGKDLHRKLQPTIGETLAGEPGIRSTYFGPGASRPVIRGLGGDQINILQNGINNMDASSNSADHNLAIDPLSVERIEIIRGPSALLYGSKAVGGVVNIIDNRIPDQPIPEKATGATDFKYNSVNNERSGSILLEGGLGNYAWHINGFKRTTDDIDIPGYARSSNARSEEPLDGDEAEERGAINNSQSDSDGVTVGISRFFDKGYFGVSLTNYETNYGIVGHGGHHDDHGDDHGDEHGGEDADVRIGMKQRRFDLAGLYKDPSEYIKAIKYKFGFSDYEHTEFEGQEIGTTFENRGYDSRVEFTHNKFGIFEGAFGLQSNRSDFSASGEEAFVPPSNTHTNSAFILEEVPLGDLKLQIGGRLDYQEINVDKVASFENVESRNDLAGSASLGFVYDLPKDYSAAISTSYTQRAPNSQELYSNGEHLATETFEVGNQDLDVQKSVGIDLSLRKNSGFLSGEVSLFYNNFQNFIALNATGEEDHDSDLPIYNYVNMPAEFYGAEVKAMFDAYDKNKHKVNFEIRGDYLEARNRSTSEHLPRISPARVGGSAIYDYNKVGLRLDVDYTFAQNNVADEEVPTEGYVMLNARTDYQINLGPTSSILYLNATNLLDQEARNHVSFLKDNIPLPGRSFMVGIKTLF
ncbi:MAG: iron complex outermembrane receptor protein [Rickettsiales bacterium]|jgi:iron complex outermembrane receptor protein